MFLVAVDDVAGVPAATSGLDGRAVQGARLKFESLLEAWVRIPLQALPFVLVCTLRGVRQRVRVKVERGALV